MKDPSQTFSIQATPDGYMVCGPHAQTVAENIEGGTISSVYVILHNEYACLIDTGRYDAIYKVISDILEWQKVTLKYIILTHDHYDHIANAQRFRSHFGGKIIAHALDAPLINNPMIIYDHEAMRRLYGSSFKDAWEDLGFDQEAIGAMRGTVDSYFNVPQPIDRIVTTECSLWLGGLELRLLHTPGHSPGSLSVYVPATGSVYTGDLTFWVNPCRPYPIGNARHCITSLRRIIDLQPSYCGGGHYAGVLSPRRWLEELLCKHISLRASILKLLAEPKTVRRLRNEIFPEDPCDSFPGIPENSIQSYLADLAHDKKIIRLPGGCIYWQRLYSA